MNPNFQWPVMTMGTCYYPEHWSPSLWREDLTRMLDAGITVVRIGEFAWSLLEPTEGHFTLDYFDDFLDLCQEMNMKVIFGTPTATPPAWLTEKYPETLNASIDGILYRHGGRRHYNYNAPIYRELCARIVEKEAKHYGNHPAIIGWQIDNEMNCELDVFYSEADTVAFRAWLKERYGTLKALNEAWGTVVWSQIYSDWSEIHVPRQTNIGGKNPHQHLDFYRFISHSTRSFCKLQADILRKHVKPGDFITTNGHFPNIDVPAMVEESLNCYFYDSYPNFGYSLEEAGTRNLNDRHWTKNLIKVRACAPHFGIMEQQSGAGGWATRMRHPSPRPGQLKLWAMQSIAQGANYMGFFRWRTATMGTEIYWHGILDYDNRDNRKLAEVKDFYRLLHKLDPICGADTVPGFGLLADYDNEWDTNTDIWHRDLLKPSEEEIWVASEVNHTPYDLIYLKDDTSAQDLAKYPVLFYPHPELVNEARVGILRTYVEAGGTLILGCRAGLKDMRGQCVMMPQPGLFAELTGTDVRDFSYAHPMEEAVTASMSDAMLQAIQDNIRHLSQDTVESPQALTATPEYSDINLSIHLTDPSIDTASQIPLPVFNDVLTALPGTEILATYNNSYFAGEAALTERKLGKGRVLHLGSTFCRDNVKALLAYTGVLEPYREWIICPESVQVIMREKQGRRFLFALNYASAPTEITLRRPVTDMATAQSFCGEITMKPYDVMVFEL